MAEGINMGRKSPWSKEQYESMYNKVNSYSKMLTARVTMEEGMKIGMETFEAYNMFKYIVVYLYIHYHYGEFEDLGMENNDVSTYIMMFVANVRHFVKGMKEGMETENVFYYDTKNEIAPVLIDMCKEILYIEENF
jgi:hypothetical protein